MMHVTAADQSRIMQDQMTGPAAGMPPDPSKAFKVRFIYIVLLLLSQAPLILKMLVLPRCMKCRRCLAMRILSVCLSVCLFVTRVIPDKMEERSVQIFIPYERTFSLVF